MSLRHRMMMTLFATAVAGCATSPAPASQVITGTVTASDAVAIRAVDDNVVVTAAQVRSDGSFTLSLPPGAAYHLEVLSAAGVQRVRANGADLDFAVCAPGAPWNMGGVGPNGGNDPAGGNPPGGSNGGPNGGGPNGGGPPPDGGVNGDNRGSAMPPRGTDPAGDPCAPPPPPCADPTDTNTCQDPCVTNAAGCGCGSSDPACWPPPNACDSNGSGCDPTTPIGPQHPPGNFGCGPDAGGSASS